MLYNPKVEIAYFYISRFYRIVINYCRIWAAEEHAVVIPGSRFDAGSDSLPLIVLRSDFGKDETFRERFRQKPERQPNFLTPTLSTAVHDFGLDHDRLFIVMEICPRTDLKTVIKQLGPSSFEEAIR
jgi:hypothetical protein